MKKVLPLVVAAIALAFIVHAVYFRAATHKSRYMMDNKEGEMEWLRSEFHLSDDQYSKIKALQDDFQPKCEEHCRNLVEANNALLKLTQSSSEYTPEVAQALESCGKVKSDCRKATLEQVYAVSHFMGDDQASRYRRMMVDSLLEQPSLKND